MWSTAEGLDALISIFVNKDELEPSCRSMVVGVRCQEVEEDRLWAGHRMATYMATPRTATVPIPNYRTLSRKMPPYAGPPCLGLASIRRVSFGIPRRDTTPHTHSHTHIERSSKRKNHRAGATGGARPHTPLALTFSSCRARRES